MFWRTPKRVTTAVVYTNISGSKLRIECFYPGVTEVVEQVKHEKKSSEIERLVARRMNSMELGILVYKTVKF